MPLFRDDVVADSLNSERIGLVVKGWDEDSDLDSDDGGRGPGGREAEPRQFRVCFFDDPESVPYHVIPESRLLLLDRSFLVGDIAKYPVKVPGTPSPEPANDFSDGDSVTEVTSEVIRVEGFAGNSIQEQSGTILRVHMRVTLEHVMTGRKVEDVDARDLQYVHDVEEGDAVVLDNWFGVVKDVFDEVTVAFEDGSICVINEPPDLTPVERYHENSVFASTRVYPGLTVRADPDTWTNSGHWIQGSYRKNVHKVGVVVNVKTYSATVNWTVRNTLLEHEGEDEPEPPPTSLSDFSSVKVLRSSQEHGSFQIGDKVQFRNRQRALDLFGYSADDDTLVNQCLVVRKTSTAVDVLWQDSSLSMGVPTCKLIPCNNIDDQEVWPMDYVVYTPRAQAAEPSNLSKTAMVISASAADRTCVIAWLKDDMRTLGDKEDMSVYEVRPHSEWQFRLGHTVLVTGDNFSGENLPELDVETEWVGEVTDIAFAGRVTVHFPLSGRQMDFLPGQLLLLENGNQADVTSEEDTSRARRGTGLGLNLEDSDDVTFYGLENRSRGRRRDRRGLLDTSSHDSAESPTTWEPDDSFDRPSRGTWEDTDIIEFESASPYGNYREGDYLRVQVVGKDEEEEEEEDEVAGAANPPAPAQSAEGQPESEAKQSPTIPPGALSGGSGSPRRLSRTGAAVNSSPPRDDAGSTSELGDNDSEFFVRLRHLRRHERIDPSSDASSEGSRHWDVESETSSLSESSGVLAIGRFFNRFAIVDTPPPANHRFLSKAGPSQQSKAFAKRIKRECDMMAMGLPDGILVRSFESRLDLLRALIVGPPHTPYEAALFLFDLYLPPEYPADPPQVHFHSWTGGMGRLNPNLYEEGRVCISLLGTWHGKEDTETWSSPSSSILQVLLSIQGLVLGVEQPYFNEAGYERLVGNQEDIRNAAIYSERAFLLSVRSILHVLEESPEPFEKEVHGFFGEPMCNLERIIGRCEAIVRRTEEDGAGTVVVSHDTDSLKDKDSDAGWSAVEDRRVEGGIIRSVSKGCLKLLKVGGG
ncbi:hypothetical protein DFJ74DRAFT_324139 [Hyaloraphidium curvatum]|nr:hypothetical protein DFJ74DRAFT_324139 [Hyaloraphidium curvatum]